MKTSQIIGVVLIVAGVLGGLLTDNNEAGFLAGICCAIGLGYAFQWLPWKRKSVNS